MSDSLRLHERSIPGSPVLHYLPEFLKIHVSSSDLETRQTIRKEVFTQIETVFFPLEFKLIIVTKSLT